MFAEKPLLSTGNPSNIHLPPITKSFRRRYRPPPTPSYSSAAAKAAHIAENISALKAKYADYATWLKTSTQNTREPPLTQELLKSSLCQMGIDSTQAEQVVSKCSWYVYQFQKNLTIDAEQKHQIVTVKPKKLKQHKIKSHKLNALKDIIEDSEGTSNSLDKDDSSSFAASLPRIVNKHTVLPAINYSNLPISSHSRHVDFDQEHTKYPLNSTSSHSHSKSFKQRLLKKLQPLSKESLNDQTNSPLDSDLSFQGSSHKLGLVEGNLRSILRKQTSSSPSVTSTDNSSRKNRSRILTPSSTILDDIPLGTRSQRLFGGSECFAQIMNELEQQKNISD